MLSFNSSKGFINIYLILLISLSSLLAREAFYRTYHSLKLENTLLESFRTDSNLNAHFAEIFPMIRANNLSDNKFYVSHNEQDHSINHKRVYLINYKLRNEILSPDFSFLLKYKINLPFKIKSTDNMYVSNTTYSQQNLEANNSFSLDGNLESSNLALDVDSDLFFIFIQGNLKIDNLKIDSQRKNSQIAIIAINTIEIDNLILSKEMASHIIIQSLIGEILIKNGHNIAINCNFERNNMEIIAKRIIFKSLSEADFLGCKMLKSPLIWKKSKLLASYQEQ